MRRSLKKILKICCVLIFVMLSNIAIADPDDGDGPNEQDCEELFTIDPDAFYELCTEDPSGPIDSGVLLLMGAGMLFAIKYIKKPVSYRAL